MKMRAPVSTMPVPGKAGPGRGDGDVTPAVFRVPSMLDSLEVKVLYPV
jgi:hypothetical protein